MILHIFILTWSTKQRINLNKRENHLFIIDFRLFDLKKAILSYFEPSLINKKVKLTLIDYCQMVAKKENYEESN